MESKDIVRSCVKSNHGADAKSGNPGKSLKSRIWNAAGKFVLIFMLIAAVAGCGKSHDRAELSQAPSYDTQRELVSYLSKALQQKLIELGTANRTASVLPTEDAGKVTDLAYDPASKTLSWSYRNTGDYDLSGEVGVSDVTPIALHYLADAGDGLGDDPLEQWIDGDGSGEIAVGDVTPIALGYMSQVYGYRFFTSQVIDGEFYRVGAD
ncbi:MAG: hypothetical protein HRF49_09795, partial [bacterium]